MNTVKGRTVDSSIRRPDGREMHVRMCQIFDAIVFANTKLLDLGPASRARLHGFGRSSCSDGASDLCSEASRTRGRTRKHRGRTRKRPDEPVWTRFRTRAPTIRGTAITRSHCTPHSAIIARFYNLMTEIPWRALDSMQMCEGGYREWSGSAGASHRNRIDRIGSIWWPHWPPSLLSFSTRCTSRCTSPLPCDRGPYGTRQTRRTLPGPAPLRWCVRAGPCMQAASERRHAVRAAGLSLHYFTH